MNNNLNQNKYEYLHEYDIFKLEMSLNFAPNRNEIIFICQMKNNINRDVYEKKYSLPDFIKEVIDKIPERKSEMEKKEKFIIDHCGGGRNENPPNDIVGCFKSLCITFDNIEPTFKIEKEKGILLFKIQSISKAKEAIIILDKKREKRIESVNQQIHEYVFFLRKKFNEDIEKLREQNQELEDERKEIEEKLQKAVKFKENLAKEIEESKKIIDKYKERADKVLKDAY